MGRAEVAGRPVIPELVEVEEGRFRSEDHLFYPGLVSDPTQGRYRVDGGELVAHAMAVAERSYPGRRTLAARTIFAREGRHDLPTDYTIDALHAGRSMAFVTVRASQPERGILCESQITLVGAIEGPSHQAAPPPDVDWDTTTPAQRDIAEPPVGLVGAVDLGDPRAAAPVLRAVLPMPRTLPDTLSGPSTWPGRRPTSRPARCWPRTPASASAPRPPGTPRCWWRTCASGGPSVRRTTSASTS